VFNQPVPFIPIEQSGLTSAGVIKVPDASPQQLGFSGLFLPSEYVTLTGQLASAFPAAEQPRVSLVSYAGDLGLDGGQPQSVYNLDTSHMRMLDVPPRPLAPGQSITLPHGLGKLTFTGYRQWISLAITYDPGQLPALISAIAALTGLVISFLVRRRRIFVRARPGDSGVGAVVQLAGLTRSDAAGGFEAEFAGLTEEFERELVSGGVPVSAVVSAEVSAEPAAELDEDDAGRAPGADAVALAQSKGE